MEKGLLLILAMVVILSACATVPEHRSTCAPLPTKGVKTAGLVVGIITVPIGLVIPFTLAGVETARLRKAYPECRDKEDMGALKECINKIDLEEGRLKGDTGR